MSAPADGCPRPLLDAHCHAYDPGLKAALQGAAPGVPIGAQVVNGTHPDDWSLVREHKGAGHTRIHRAYGVHPWKVTELEADWVDQLREFLESGAVSVGEIGLDNWIEPRDEELQRRIFLEQLELAAGLELPPTIHCVRAWGALLDCLRVGPIMEKGFLVHGFGGSVEVLHQLLDLGGYVSFSAYGAHPGRKRIRDATRACPGDRILLETDAPDMVPPVETCRFSLMDADGRRLHHPGEILTAYEQVAQWRGESLEQLVEQVERNFQLLFGE